MVARTLSAAAIAALRLPTASEMLAVASAIPQVGQASWRRHNDGPATFLEVGPGVIRMARSRPGQADHEKDLTWENRMRAVSEATARIIGVHTEPMALLNDADMALATAPEPGREALRRRPSKATRGKIVGWSRRSRNRMQIRLNSLDWTPLFEAGLEPALVTLTLPGDWQTVAPTPQAYRSFIDRFRVYYSRAWGEQPVGVWKQEFQRRGAPHTHVLMTPPSGLSHARGDLGGLEFSAWLSRVWARIVAHPDADEYERHLRAGTGIDYVGEGYRDPRRIAQYFGKHGTFDAKEYQNEMPRLWRDAIAEGEAGSQFWGVWGLKKALAVLQLEDSAAADISEHYRRLAVEREERRASATDSSVARVAQRTVDSLGSSSPDADKVARHLRKLSRSLAMRGQALERNKHGQPVLPRERIRKVDRTMYDTRTGEQITRRSYKIGYYHGGEGWSGPGGYLLVHDGAAAARDIHRLLDSRSRWALSA